MHQIVCVNGAIPPSDLGVTLVREQLLHDISALLLDSADATKLHDVQLSQLGFLRLNPLSCYANLRINDTTEITEELCQLAKLESSGVAIVDAACKGTGRNPHALRSMSKASQVHVIMSCGYFTAKTHPSILTNYSERELADEMVRELRHGVIEMADVVEPIRAGVITIGTDDLSHASEAKVAQAAAMAQRETGAPLLVHLNGWRRCGHQILDFLQKNGCNLSKVCLAQMSPSFEDAAGYQRSLVERGCYLAFDMVGLSGVQFPGKPTMCPSDDQIARNIFDLVSMNAGFADKILVGHDTFLRMQLSKYGGHGLTHISRDFVPRLARMGVSAVVIRKLTVDNAREWLAWWEDVPEEIKPMETWQCNYCNQSLEENVPKFSKFEFNYCSIKCLLAHRKQLNN